MAIREMPYEEPRAAGRAARVIFEATGFSPMAFQCADVLGKNGVLILSSVTGGSGTASVNTDHINQGFVLGNKMLVAEVFAKNGFLVLSSITGEEQTSEVNADQIDQGKRGGDTPKGVLLTRA